jgi:hypothetical protein
MAQILYYESGRDLVAFTALTDDGDHINFNHPSIQYLSAYEDDDASYDATVRPNGVLSGGVGTPDGTNNKVDVTAVSCYLKGVWFGTGGDSAAIAATTMTIVRGTATTNPYKISSITIATGGVPTVVAGAGSTAHSEVRDAAGGPPLIPTTSFELFQVRTTVSTAGLITAAEIKAVPGTHRELAVSPSYEIIYARETSNVLGYAGVKFVSALPTIHTGAVCKKVYLKGYSADFAEWVDARNFTPSDTTGSLSSETFYTRSIGAIDESINSGSFEWGVSNPVTDSQLEVIGKMVWLKYKPNKLTAPTIINQGKIYGTPPNPATGVNVAGMTVLAKTKYLRLA